MASDRQTRANQANAKSSTGPKTESGKAVSRTNAVKHGLQAETFVLPGEDQDEFEVLSDRLFAELSPEGMLEIKLAEDIVISFWRLRRARNVDTGLFKKSPGHSDDFIASLGSSFIQNSHSDFFGKLSRYEKSIENSLYRALSKIDELKLKRLNSSAAEDGDSKIIDTTPISIVNHKEAS